MWNPPTLQKWAVGHEDGATAVEYALMIGLIAIVIFAAVTAFGLAIPGLFEPASVPLSS